MASAVSVVPPAGLSKAIIESSDDAIISTSLDGMIITWNHAAEAMYGYTAAEVIGKSVSVIIPAAKQEEREAILVTIRAGERIRHFETERLRKDGALVPVSISLSPVLNECGEVIACASISHDIGDLKKSEERMREAFRYARSLLEASLDPLVAISPQGKITDVNEAAVKVTGVGRDELIGTDFSTYFTDPEQAEAGYRRVLAEGTVTDYPLTIRHRDGRLTKTLNNAAVYRDAAGRVLGVFAAARDLTAQLRAEEEILALNRNLEQRVHDRTAALEASNRELEAFTYSVSHDLRAPLRAIAGFAQMLKRKREPALDPEGWSQLDRIEANANTMRILIDELLKLSRLGRASMNIETIDTTAVAQAAIQDLHDQAEEAGVEVAVEELPPCQADRTLLQQVYANLVSNAIKFSRRRAGARVEIGSHREGGRTVFDVRDNGVGFDMRYAAKLFGVFQRLHRQSDFEGTGVGLAVVQRIVHRHGGSIWAEAEPDKGASFHFTLEGDPIAAMTPRRRLD